MIRLIRLSSLLVVLSGLVLAPWVFPGQATLVLLHLLLATGYSVLFLLFLLDHLKAQMAPGQAKGPAHYSGMLLLAVSLLALLTGFVLYLFGSERLSPWSEVHLGMTLAFVVLMPLHQFTKAKEGKAKQ